MKCKNNHESTTSDFCSVCGIEMVEGETAPAALPVRDEETCPVCGSVKTENFCGECGYNFLIKSGGIAEPPPLQPVVVVGPTVAVAASPAPAEEAVEGNASAMPAPETASAAPAEKLEVHMTVDAAVEGAPQTPLRIFPLEAGDYPIGRPSLTRKIKPAISADGDDGVSHKHALIREQDGCFAIMDLGSSNGTMLNGVEIIPNTVHTLKKDDVIAIGRWTRLTIRSRQ